jgi:hypothetical protein
MNVTHNNSMHCPACGNRMCRYVKVNSPVPYEEIEQAIHQQPWIRDENKTEDEPRSCRKNYP